MLMKKERERERGRGGKKGRKEGRERGRGRERERNGKTTWSFDPMGNSIKLLQNVLESSEKN